MYLTESTHYCFSFLSSSSNPFIPLLLKKSHGASSLFAPEPQVKREAGRGQSVSLGTPTSFGDETGSVPKVVQLPNTPLPHLENHHHLSGAQQCRETTLQAPSKHRGQRVSPWAHFTYVDCTGSASPTSDGESGLVKPASG